MARRLIIPVLAAAALGACGPDVPALDARIGAEARAADFPDLVPLGPLLAGVDAIPPRRSRTRRRQPRGAHRRSAPPRRRAPRAAAVTRRALQPPA